MEIGFQCSRGDHLAHGYGACPAESSVPDAVWAAAFPVFEQAHDHDDKTLAESLELALAAAVSAVQADNNRRIEALAADYYEAAEAITNRDTGSLARRDVYRQAATNIRALRAALASPAEPGAPACPDHKPVQHRDRKPPWCRRCGWTSATPAIPARQIAEPGGAE